MLILKKLFKDFSLGTLLIVLFLFILAGSFNPNFLKINNIFQTINGSAVYALVTLGMSCVIFTGEIDVSVGAVLGLSSAITGKLVLSGASIWVIILAAILTGVCIGLVNGIGVNFLKIPSIIMTLGTNGIVRGTIYLYTGGKWIEGLDFKFKSLAQLSINRTFSYFYIIAILLTTGLYFYFTRTKSGKTFKAIGDNYDGARLIGLPVDRTKYLSYILCSVLASLAGIFYTSRVGFVTPTAGVGYEMIAVAACVIGGINLSGGQGTVFGALFGALLMGSISRILVFLGLPSTFDNTITGLMLILIVVVTAIFNKRSIEKLRVARLSARIE